MRRLKVNAFPTVGLLKPLRIGMMIKKTVVFAAVCNGEMIGFANGSWVLDEGELLNIAVLEKYRRQGLAEILLKTLEDFFTEKNITVIYLEVREKNQSALSFYENMVLQKRI